MLHCVDDYAGPYPGGSRGFVQTPYFDDRKFSFHCKTVNA